MRERLKNMPVPVVATMLGAADPEQCVSVPGI